MIEKLGKKEIEFPSHSSMTSEIINLIKKCMPFNAKKNYQIHRNEVILVGKEIDVGSIIGQFQTFTSIEADFKQTQKKKNIVNHPKPPNEIKQWANKKKSVIKKTI
ncbi:hypothetical protein M9Y10_024414 [Tritrichomonas musculus]|uniref:Uncharacterized protein n=1 Tax=Tritrichomonas musculus TaxID=1915356 RepID=A0ABR2HE74_9EUKA